MRGHPIAMQVQPLPLLAKSVPIAGRTFSRHDPVPGRPHAAVGAAAPISGFTPTFSDTRPVADLRFIIEPGEPVAVVAGAVSTRAVATTLAAVETRTETGTMDGLPTDRDICRSTVPTPITPDGSSEAAKKRAIWCCRHHEVLAAKRPFPSLAARASPAP